MKLNRNNRLLLVGIGVMLYLCYTFAISGTLSWYSKYEELRKVDDAGSIGQDQLRYLVAKDKQLDRALEKLEMPKGKSYQGVLLKKITGLGAAGNVKIIDFREPHIYTSGTSQQSSYSFTLQGSFKSILELINGIERDPSFGVVKHVKFEKKKDYRNNTDYLLADVMLQKNETTR